MPWLTSRAQGNVFIARALPHVREYGQIRTFFRETIARDSESDAATVTDTILGAYGIQPSISVEALQQALIDFASDTAFGYSIEIAHRDLSLSRSNSPPSHGDTNSAGHGAVPRRHATSARRYRIKFGNPFPGPNHGYAHHCVDLVYLFGVFQDFLLAQDEKDKAAASSSAEQHDRQRSEDTGHVSNFALSQTIQRHWIDFIAGGSDSGASEPLPDEDSVLVFGRDRVARIQSLHHDPDWIALQRKFDVIGRHRRQAVAIVNRLIRSAFP